MAACVVRGPGAVAAGARLRLDTDNTEPVRLAGLSSLAARGLLGVVDGRVRVAPEVAAVLDGLVGARWWVTTGLVAEDVADGAHVCASDGVRFLVCPRAFRCFEVVGLDPNGDLRDPVVQIAADFVGRNAPAVAALEIERTPDGGMAAPDVGTPVWPRLVSLVLAQDGRWSLSTGTVVEVITEHIDGDQPEAALRAALGEALGAESPA